MFYSLVTFSDLQSYLNQCRHQASFHLVVAGSPETEAEGKRACRMQGNLCRGSTGGCLRDLSGGLH